MSFKKIPNGDYYYFNVNGNTVSIVKNIGITKQGHVINNLLCPKELIGKRVRVKLELVREKEDK